MATRKSPPTSIQSAITAIVQVAIEEAIAAELERVRGTIADAVQTQVATAMKSAPSATANSGVSSLGGVILRWVSANPNSRMEEIAKGLRRPSAKLKPEIMRLLADGRLSKRGVARGTNYRVTGKATTVRPAGATGKRVRRSTDALDKLAGRIHTYVSKHPGSRSEQIAKALGVPSKELVRPVKLLLGQKALSSKGKARGTQYSPGRNKPRPSEPTASKGGARKGAKKTVARKGAKKKVARKGAKKKAARKGAKKKAPRKGAKKKAARKAR